MPGDHFVVQSTTLFRETRRRRETKDDRQVVFAKQVAEKGRRTPKFYREGVLMQGQGGREGHDAENCLTFLQNSGRVEVVIPAFPAARIRSQV